MCRRRRCGGGRAERGASVVWVAWCFMQRWSWSSSNAMIDFTSDFLYWYDCVHVGERAGISRYIWSMEGAIHTLAITLGILLVRSVRKYNQVSFKKPLEYLFSDKPLRKYIGHHTFTAKTPETPSCESFLFIIVTTPHDPSSKTANSQSFLLIP